MDFRKVCTKTNFPSSDARTEVRTREEVHETERRPYTSKTSTTVDVESRHPKVVHSLHIIRSVPLIFVVVEDVGDFYLPCRDVVSGT